MQQKTNPIDVVFYKYMLTTSKDGGENHIKNPKNPKSYYKAYGKVAPKSHNGK